MKPRHLIPALLCALMIAYPLSEGPVKRFYMDPENFGVPLSVWNFYNPVDEACLSCPIFFQRVHFWHLDLWMPPRP